MPIDRYDVAFDFAPAERRFTGRVEVTFSSEGGPFRLHAVDLALSDPKLDGAPVALETDPAAEEVRVAGVRPGPHRFQCAFAGRILPDGLIGMYVSPFGPGGEILTTQLYPTGARRLFPCRDVPAEKAEFHVTVTVPRASAVVFNTDAEERRTEGDRQTLRFRPTPKMSTYLLYLGIGPFEERVQEETGLRTIVAHPTGRAADAAFALDHAARMVREFEGYYAIPYPLPKLHLVAVPSFWAGAMENWGAITFREVLILVTPDTGTLTRRYIRQTLAHEIAHQWFGNLVTNAWWNDFWLNEAFATFVSNRIIDRLFPGEGTWPDFVYLHSGRGFNEDALESAHPIEVPIGRPEEIGEIADQITYGKGASLLRMIEAYLGEATFRRGVTAYLNAHRYGVAVGADLWNALAAVSDVPVARIMQAWVTKPGHPVVEVRRDGEALVLTQRRFHFDGRADPDAWPIPLQLSVGGQVARTLLEATPVRWPAPSGARVVVNPERTGFFHVRYDPGLAEALLTGWDQLSEIDQWGTLLDRFFFLRSGEGSLADYLAVIARVTARPQYLPSLLATAELQWLAPFGTIAPALAEAQRAFFGAEFRRLGAHRRPGEPARDGTLRQSVAAAATLFLPEVAQELGGAYRDTEDAVDADVKDVAVEAFVRTGGPEAWRTVRRRLSEASTDEVVERLAAALPLTPDGASFGATLELLEGPTLTASRIWDVLLSARYNLGQTEALWTWLERELPRLAERWQGTPLLSSLMRDGLPWYGLGRVERVRAYFAGHAFPGAERGIRGGLEGLALRHQLYDRLRAGP